MTFCYAATDQNTHGQFDTAQPGDKIYTSNLRVLQGKFCHCFFGGVVGKIFLRRIKMGIRPQNVYPMEK